MPRETKQQRLEREAELKSKRVQAFKANYHSLILDVVVRAMEYHDLYDNLRISYELDGERQYYNIETRSSMTARYRDQVYKFPVELLPDDSEHFISSLQWELQMLTQDVDISKFEIEERARKIKLKSEAERKIREALTNEEYEAYIGEKHA